MMSKFNPPRDKVACADRFLRGELTVSEMVEANCSELELSALVDWLISTRRLTELKDSLAKINVPDDSKRYLTHQARAHVASAEQRYLKVNKSTN